MYQIAAKLNDVALSIMSEPDNRDYIYLNTRDKIESIFGTEAKINGQIFDYENKTIYYNIDIVSARILSLGTLGIFEFLELVAPIVIGTVIGLIFGLTGWQFIAVLAIFLIVDVLITELSKQKIIARKEQDLAEGRIDTETARQLNENLGVGVTAAVIDFIKIIPYIIAGGITIALIPFLTKLIPEKGKKEK